MERTGKRQQRMRGIASALATVALMLTATGLRAQPSPPDATSEALDRPVPTSDLHMLSLREAIAGRNDLSVFLKLVEAGELTEYLDGRGSYTIIAPTNAAFAYLRESSLNSWERVRPFVLRHVVPGRHSLDALAERGHVTTLDQDQGRQSYKVETKDGRIMIGGVAWVVAENIETRNGVIHVVSRFLPKPAVHTPR